MGCKKCKSGPLFRPKSPLMRCRLETGNKEQIKMCSESADDCLKFSELIINLSYGWCLRVRRVSSLALPAFLASAASTLFLQDDILSGCICSDSVFLQSYLVDISALSRHSATQTAILGPSRYFGRPSSDEVQLEHAVWVSFFSGSLITT